MQYINKMTISAAVLSTAVVFGVFAIAVQPSLAEQPKVVGTYAFTGAGGCLQSASGFNANLTPVDPTGNVALTQTVEGTVTFNSDGTGTRSGTSMTIVEPPATSPSVNVSTFAGAFTFTVDGDGTIHFQTSTSTTGTFLQGPRTGQTFSVDEIELSGHAGKNGDTIVLATTVAGVETISFSNGDSAERVCNRSRVETAM